jgi:hypothetical protein
LQRPHAAVPTPDHPQPPAPRRTLALTHVLVRPNSPAPRQTHAAGYIPVRLPPRKSRRNLGAARIQARPEPAAPSRPGPRPWSR